MVKIGCIKTLIPFIHHTQVRYTVLTLYACIGRPNNLNQLVLEQIKTCAISSALTAAVIGIAFEALAAALVAFKALFVQCVKSSVEGDISCFIPDLVILSEKGDWNDVK